MYDSKLIQTLITFDTKERKELTKFVRSSYHNQHKNVSRLLAFIFESRQITAESVSKMKAYECLFPGEAFDNMRIIHVMSYLLKIVESFLAYQQWKSHPTNEQLNLIRNLRNRRLDKQFRQEIKSFRKIQEKQPYRDSRYHYFNYQLELEHYRHISEQRRVITSNLQEISNGLNSFFIAEKLKQTCEILSHKNVEIKEYDLGLLDEVLNYVERQSRYLEIPAIAVYFHGYKILSQVDENHFYSFKDLLLEYQTAFPKEELKDLYLIAINFCIKQLNLGSTNFNKDLFELYQSGLETGIFMNDGILSRYTYTNIVTLGLKMNAFEWVQDFLLDYKKYLDKRYRNAFLDYNQAKLYYEQKQYRKAMRILLQTDVDDVLVYLDGKRMLLKMYYELEEFDALEALIDSFRTYLTRKKVIAYHKTNYKNILSILKKMIYLNRSDETEKHKLRIRIESEEILTERNWLLEQLG